jgi:hypothetical protein
VRIVSFFLPKVRLYVEFSISNRNFCGILFGVFAVIWPELLRSVACKSAGLILGQMPDKKSQTQE